MKAPVIGITLDWRESGEFSRYPWYALRQNYADCLSKFGAVPVFLPFENESVDAYLDLIDGLMITGGDFDVDPALYGEKVAHERVETIESRTSFEYEITKKALQKDMPVFGICGGMQLLNVVLGGTLVQHIPDEYDSDIEHEQPNPRNEVGHSAQVVEGSQLHDILGKADIMVNSAHHQAVKKVPAGVIVNATAPDGVIEGIEATDYRFCIGVQWHPEFLITPEDEKVCQAFVEAAR